MRALVFHSYGGPEVLTVADVPEPHAGPGEIRVTVAAASLNPWDWKVRRGVAAGGRELVGVGRLGLDAAGVVDEVGEGVTGVAVGDEVFGPATNGQAEHAVLRAWATKPPSVEFAVAAGAVVAGETAERALRLLDVQPGQVLFIDGGAGGVGSAAVQMATARGVTVIASANQANHDYLRGLGAIPVLYGAGLVDRVRAVPVEQVDAVFDTAGKTPISDLVSLAPEPARVLSIANFAAAEAGAQVTGGGADSHWETALGEVAELLADGRLTVEVQKYALADAAAAHRASESGHVRGKIVFVG